MKSAHRESWDTFIWPSDRWADRAAPVLFMGVMLLGGGAVLSDAAAPLPLDASRVSSLWVIFALWLVIFLLACARAAWMFFGVTKLSVFADELIVSRCLGHEVISASNPIKMTAVRDAFIEEREFTFKGTKWHRWNLMLRLEAGGTQLIVGFKNSREADDFMARFRGYLRGGSPGGSRA